MHRHERRDQEQGHEEPDNEYQCPHITWSSRLHCPSPEERRTGPDRSVPWSVAAIRCARAPISINLETCSDPNRSSVRNRSAGSGGRLPGEEEEERHEADEDGREQAGADDIPGSWFHVWATSPGLNRTDSGHRT